LDGVDGLLCRFTRARLFDLRLIVIRKVGKIAKGGRLIQARGPLVLQNLVNMSNDWLSGLAESPIALALPMQKLAVLKSAFERG
jgi:hypothetical protein